MDELLTLVRAERIEQIVVGSEHERPDDTPVIHVRVRVARARAAAAVFAVHDIDVTRSSCPAGRLGRTLVAIDPRHYARSPVAAAVRFARANART